jgi:hypothetical protein
MKISSSVYVGKRSTYEQFHVKYHTTKCSRSVTKTFRDRKECLDFCVSEAEWLTDMPNELYNWAVRNKHPIKQKRGWAEFL